MGPEHADMPEPTMKMQLVRHVTSIEPEMLFHGFFAPQRNEWPVYEVINFSILSPFIKG